jgi:hypothetical protein
MAWLPLHDTYTDDAKNVALRSLLKFEEADVYPTRLWLWALKNRPDGKLLPGDVERVCRWRGKRGRLEAAMREARWLDKDGNINNWEQWAGLEIARIEEERRAERERKAKWRKSRKCPGDNGGTCPGDNGGTCPVHCPGDMSHDVPPPVPRDSRAPARSRPRAPAESRAEQSIREHEDKNTSGAGAPKDDAQVDASGWRKHVPQAVQELVDVLRREVTKYSPEAVWGTPTKQEAIAGNRLVGLYRAGKIPGAGERQRERLLFVLHAAPASEFWRGKLFTLNAVEKHLNALLELTRKDWDTWKADPDPLAVFAQCR